MATAYINWDYQDALTQESAWGGRIDVTTNSNPIKYLFYTTAQIAGHFPSEDDSGNNGWDINEPFSFYPPLDNIMNILGPPPTLVNVTDIASKSYVYSIRATAGLLYWFAKEADLLPQIYNVNFQNNFIGVGNNGNIKVNGTTYSSPTNNFSVTEGTTIEATAITQSFNNISYSFSNWSNGSTTATTTFTPTANTTYTANFVGKPNNVNRALHFINQNMQPITLLWNEHPNINVTQYQIWRKVKYKKGTTGPPVLIGTVNRGTTSFVDNDYMGTNLGFTDWLLYYDVKAYYLIEQTYSDDDYVSIFANGSLIMEIKKNNEEKLSALEERKNVIKENTLDNFPNPFNPSTVISYQIVKAGQVTLKVYDTLGKEVAILVDKEQSSGKYSVNFNASSLSSGIYLYRITANGFMAVKKMILLR